MTDRTAVQQICDEMKLAPVPDGYVPLPDFAEHLKLTMPQVMSAAWKAGIAFGQYCNPDVDPNAAGGFNPVVRAITTGAASRLAAWLRDNTPPADTELPFWDDLWNEYHEATRPKPKPSKPGDWCRDHGVPVVDWSRYSSAQQIADETGLTRQQVLIFATHIDAPFVEVCNPDFETDLAASGQGRPTVRALAAGNVPDFLEKLTANFNGGNTVGVDETVRALGANEESRPPVSPNDDDDPCAEAGCSYINMPPDSQQDKHARLDESASLKSVYRGMLAHGCPVNVVQKDVIGQEFEGNDKWVKVTVCGYVHSSLVSDEYVPWANGDETQGEKAEEGEE